METIERIDLSVSGSPSLIMRDLSEYATLPFLAAFDVQALPKSQTPQKRITYIAISKKTMPMLVELFLRFKGDADIYGDGTLEAVLSVGLFDIKPIPVLTNLYQAYSIPVKLKYDCPPPSKHGKDPPLWKTATTSFLRIVKECSVQIKALGAGRYVLLYILHQKGSSVFADIPDDRVEGIWRQVLDVFRGGILADW